MRFVEKKKKNCRSSLDSRGGSEWLNDGSERDVTRWVSAWLRTNKRDAQSGVRSEKCQKWQTEGEGGPITTYPQCRGIIWVVSALSLSLSHSLFLPLLSIFPSAGSFNSAWTKQANKDMLSQPKTTPARGKLCRERRRRARWRLWDLEYVVEATQTKTSALGRKKKQQQQNKKIPEQQLEMCVKGSSFKEKYSRKTLWWIGSRLEWL